MAVGKTNPLRQQMINMMYLVLTALLALNVSAEILKAFQTVNEGMRKSINLMDSKNEVTMKAFDKLMKTSPATTKEYYDLAERTNKIADELYDYIQNWIDRVIEESGGTEIEGKGEEAREVMKGMKDLETCPRLFIEEGYGDEIEKKVNEARQQFIDIISQVKTIDVKAFEPNITLKAEKRSAASKSWAIESFHMVPAIAGVTLLTKIQQDIRTTQANILDALYNSIGAADMTFDELIPVVKADKTSVAVGEKFTAEVLLAAYDSKQQPEIYIDGKKYEVKNGKAIYEDVPTSQGSVEKEIKIVVKNKKTGESKEYLGKLAYDVFMAPAIISATKMNVVYIGLQNPISISVPGFRPSDIIATTSFGTLKSAGKPGDYLLEVPDTRGRVREVVITAAVKLPDGGTKVMGKKNFRIKNVPKPTPKFGSKESGEISPGEIRLVNFITVVLEDFAFEGLKYKVDKFRFIYQPKRGEARIVNGKGPRLTSQMRSLLSSPQRGDRIIIDNIYASAPGVGQKRLGSSIVLTVK